eukprot:1606694-Pleurochrysis_carterae.AAC.1
MATSALARAAFMPGGYDCAARVLYAAPFALLPTTELFVPGGTLFAMSCVVFGDGAPKVHWSKKMRPTPAIDARRIMS